MSTDKPAPAAPSVTMPVIPSSMVTRIAVLSGDRPYTGLDYGPIRKGKTTNLTRWLLNGLAFGDPTPILQSADTWTGVKPIVPKNPVENLRDATAYLLAVAEKKREGKWLHIKRAGFDDFSLACDEEYVLICDEIRGKNGYDRVNALRDAILDYRRAAKRAGIDLHHNAHLAEPVYDKRDPKKIVYPGGPRMPIKTTRDWIPAVATTICLVNADPRRAGDFKVSAFCDPSDPLYIHGDRLHTAPLRGPLNTAEFLRAAGRIVERAPALEEAGAEALVEKIAVRLIEGMPLPEVAGKVWEILSKRFDDARHIEWVLQDGCDRAEIRKSIMQRRLGRFFNPTPGEPDPKPDDGLLEEDIETSEAEVRARVEKKKGKSPDTDDTNASPRSPRPGAGAASVDEDL